ncbi:Ubx domain-containing protein, partial [Coemansia sp. RSA 2320]
MDGLPSLGQAQTASSSDEVNQLARFICSLIGDSIERHEVELRLARSEQEGREAERRLREQQNAAYEASLARDRERESVARAKEEQERMERQREEERQRKSLRIGELQTQWRWATLARLLAEEEREAANIDGGGPTNGEVCKLNLRLENGSRIIKTFPADVELQRLFDFVETRAVAGEWEARKETPYGPDLHSVEFPEGYEHDYDFVLVSQFPRVVFGDKRAILKSALQAKSMWPSATLI